MIWIIASIPFWALALGLFVIGFGGLLFAVCADEMKTDDFRKGLGVSSMVLIASGLIAVIAAKLCS